MRNLSGEFKQVPLTLVTTTTEMTMLCFGWVRHSSCHGWPPGVTVGPVTCVTTLSLTFDLSQLPHTLLEILYLTY